MKKRGLQVFQANGHLLWQKAAHLPTKGAHRFQPVSDSTTVYSVQTALTGEIVAYNLQDGREIWTQKLNTNLDYAPPLVLDQGTLYIAGEQTIFALNSSDGQIRWQMPITARTLLSAKNGAASALFTAGAEGISELNPDTGETLWRFSGQSNGSLTTAQFYQASLAQDMQRGDIIYATGIRWSTPRIEEQAWLYAIDASTGKQLWTQQLGAGFTSGDSSRVFTPLIDQSRQNIIIQHQESTEEQHISAYAMGTGNLRWDTTIHNVRQTAPALLQIADGTIILFGSANNSITALTTLPAGPYLILLAGFLSLPGLLLLWAPRVVDSKHVWQIFCARLQKSGHHLLKRIAEKRKSGKRLLLLISIGLLLLLSSIIGYRQIFSTDGAGIYQINAADGSLQRQPIDQSGTLIKVDVSGSISKQQGQHLQWLQATSPDGSQWQTFASEGNFGLATAEAQSPLLLTTLTASKSQRYQFAANDPGYPNALAHLFMLASFARADGQLNWQRTIVQPQEQQQATLIGADQRYIYISSLPVIGTDNTETTAQLLAVNQQTGNIDWRIFGPSSKQSEAGENERLFIQQNQLIWQIQRRIYLLDANSGQIEWQRSVPSGSSEKGLQIQHMAVTSSGQIIIATQQQLFSIEQRSGNLLWSQAIPNNAPGIQLLTAGEIVLVGTGKQLQAYTAATQQLLWTQQLPGTLQQIISANDGKQIYVSLQSAAQSKTVAILALASREGKISWRYQIPEQSEQVDLLAEKNERLLISSCEGKRAQACSKEQVSLLDTNRGAMLWQTERRAIRAIFLNPGENSISIQTGG